MDHLDYNIPIAALNYDDLPEGSDIQREQGGDGVTIFIPAGEPRPGLRRKISQEAMLASAGICALFVGLSGTAGAIFMDVWRLSTPLLMLAIGLFAIFNLAAFVFVWRLRYLARMEAITAARKRATMLIVRPDRLNIETANSSQADHREIESDEIELIRILYAPEEFTWGVNDPVAMLELHLKDDRNVRLAPGREEAELMMIAMTIHRMMNAPLPMREGFFLRLLRVAGM